MGGSGKGFKKGKKVPGWFLAWNILLRVLLPAEAFGAGSNRVYHNPRRHYQEPQPHGFHHSWQNDLYRYQLPIEISTALMAYTDPLVPIPQKNSFSAPYFPRMESVSYHRPGWGGVRRRQDMLICDGRNNLLQDLGVLAIAMGALGTVMGIFSASYYSVVGNTISVISGVVSFLSGIPSAVITYLAVSDRISYAIANVLSVLSLLNTAYGLWSVDFGNRDILTSQTANVIGVLSLILSIITAFPDFFDSIILAITQKYPEKKSEVHGFVRRYGCIEGSPAFYDILEDILRQIAKL